MLADRRLTGATVAVRKNSVLHDGCFVDNSGRIIDIDFATANHSSQDIATDGFNWNHMNKLQVWSQVC